MNKEVGIYDSAALAFHKALIGITQLDSLEKAASEEKSIGSFRNSKAIQVYYIVYHLFTMVMLLSDEYEPKTPKEYSKVKESELNSPSELPEQWNRQRELESDFATIIQHAQIKKFCKKIRSLRIEDLNPLLQILYFHFIQPPQNEEERCIPGLYEKLCYVRDRAIYRPSNVILDDGEEVQTSLDLRKEIDSIPNAVQLYAVLCQLYDVILKLSFNDDKDKRFQNTIHKIWHSPVSSSVSDLEEIGLSSEQIETIMKLEYGGVLEGLNFNSHICQLIELEDPAFIKAAIEKWWDPLEQEYIKIIKSSKIKNI